MVIDPYINKLPNKHVIHLMGDPNSIIIKVGRNKVRSLIDTGASLTIRSWKFYNSLKNKPKLQKVKTSLETVENVHTKL